MNIYPMSDKARAAYELSEKREPNILKADFRCKYPYFKLNVGQSFAFDLDEYNERQIRASASQYQIRNGCKIACIKHGNFLEVARIG